MKTILALAFLVVATAANAGWTGQRIGDFDYWHNSNGGSVTCQTIGQFRYCN